jgi:MSHA biogenesis protein MshK
MDESMSRLLWKHGQAAILIANMMLAVPVSAHAADGLSDPTRPPAASMEPGSTMIQTGPVLQSVKISPTHRSAVISGQEVEVGSLYGDEKVVNISESEVVLRSSEGTQTLKLFPSVDKHNVPVLEKKPSVKAHPKKKLKGK